MLLDGWSVDERVGAGPDHYAHHRTVKDTTGAARSDARGRESGFGAPREILAECNRKRWGRRKRRAKGVYLARSLGLTCR